MIAARQSKEPKDLTDLLNLSHDALNTSSEVCHHRGGKGHVDDPYNHPNKGQDSQWLRLNISAVTIKKIEVSVEETPDPIIRIVIEKVRYKILHCVL